MFKIILIQPNPSMKKNIKPYIFTLLLLVLIEKKIEAQSVPNGWQIGINIGFAIYQGDLSPQKFGAYNTVQPALQFGASKVFMPAIKLRTAISFGSLKADESAYTLIPFRKQRALSFNASFKEISAMIVYNFTESYNEIPRKFSPYIFAGVGAGFFKIIRNSSKFNAAFFANDPDATIGLAADLQIAPPNTLLLLPVGFGVDYYLSPVVSLNAEFNFKYNRSDYLDGFSKAANTKKNDYFYITSIGILYKFTSRGKLDCPVINL